jgi:hypothetical protein
VCTANVRYWPKADIFLHRAYLPYSSAGRCREESTTNSMAIVQRLLELSLALPGLILTPASSKHDI